MKLLEFLILVLILSIFTINPVSAEMSILFVAADDPNAEDINGNLINDSNEGSVDVWTFSGGGSGTSSFVNSSWVINSGGTGQANTASVTASIFEHVDVFGAGSNLSIDFENGTVGVGGSVGVQLLSGGSVVSEFSFARIDGQYQLDGENSGVAFNTQNMTLSWMISDLAGGYTFAVNGSQVLPDDSLMFTAGLLPDSIRVFNNSTGSFGGTNLFLNNLELTGVPEPATLATFGVATSLLFKRRRRS